MKRFNPTHMMLLIALCAVSCEKTTFKKTGAHPDELLMSKKVDAFALAQKKSGRIVFNSGSSNWDIFIMNGDGTGVVQLTDHLSGDFQPALSPNGEQIAFVSSRDGNRELYFMNSDGTNLVRLTHDPGSDVEPVWSHNGKRIAFSTNRDGNQEIYVMDADGTNLVNLTNSASDETDPPGRQLVNTSPLPVIGRGTRISTG